MVHTSIFPNPNFPHCTFIDLAYDLEAVCQRIRRSILEMAIGEAVDIVADDIVIRSLGNLGHLNVVKGRGLDTGGDEGEGPNSERLELAPPYVACHDESGFGGVVHACFAMKSNISPSTLNWNENQGEM